MSSRRRTRVSNINEDEINDLILKLQPLLPPQYSRRSRRHATTVPPSEVLRDVCNYIRSLQREADELGGRLSHLLPSLDTGSGVDADALIRLLQQY